MKNTAGYSGTPLAKKLGIKEGYKINVINDPDNSLNLSIDLPKDLEWINNRKERKNFIHYFAENCNQFGKDISILKNEIVSDGINWMS
jgi:preprotein translocase subunit SecA